VEVHSALQIRDRNRRDGRVAAPPGLRQPTSGMTQRNFLVEVEAAVPISALAETVATL
jgi:hypothetical protein